MPEVFEQIINITFCMSGVTGLGAGCTVAEVFGLKLGPHRVNSAPMIYGRQYNNSNIFPFAMFQKQHFEFKIWCGGSGYTA